MWGERDAARREVKEQSCAAANKITAATNISPRRGHESPFKVKTKLKQTRWDRLGRTWHAVIRGPGSEIKVGGEGIARRGVDARESQLFTKLFRILARGSINIPAT